MINKKRRGDLQDIIYIYILNSKMLKIERERERDRVYVHYIVNTDAWQSSLSSYISFYHLIHMFCNRCFRPCLVLYC